MNKTVKTLISLVIVAALSLGILFGSDILTRSLLEEQQSAAIAETFGELLDAKRYDPLSAGDWEAVEAAYQAKDGDGNVVGYGVTVKVQGYAGPIEVHTAFSADGATLKGIRIGSHTETAGYGARITNTVFTSQFQDITPPVHLAGGETAMKDGTYTATAKEADSGFFDTVKITVSGGEITAADWDAINADGASKKELSKAGQYVMSETGLPWHKQAEIMEQALLYTQDPTKITYDADTGKTDAYTGATIRVSPFVALAAEALRGAMTATTGEGAPIDGISGATYSSKAVITAVNTAAQFVQNLSETVR